MSTAEPAAGPRTALLLTCGHAGEAGSVLRRLSTPERQVVALDQYALDVTPLENVTGLLISMHSDQRFLAARADRLESYLRVGGTVVASGHHAYPFLPGVSLFRPSPSGHLRDLEIHREVEHSIWEGVSERDLTFRKGVAGFYGRGWHEPPKGALVIHSLGPRRVPLDILWRVGAGRALLHGGNDLWQFGGGSDDSAGRIAPQLLAWIFDQREIT